MFPQKSFKKPLQFTNQIRFQILVIYEYYRFWEKNYEEEDDDSSTYIHVKKDALTMSKQPSRTEKLHVNIFVMEYLFLKLKKL